MPALLALRSASLAAHGAKTHSCCRMPLRLAQMRPSAAARLLSAQRTFDNQQKLPRLPVPPLENLSSKFIASCRPLLAPEELADTESALDEFVAENGVGRTLQKRLIEFDKSQPNSWLEDLWLNKAYLEWREPSLINVNWWCAFVPHPEHPEKLVKKHPPKGVFSSFQIKRAAGLITNMLNFKDMLDREEIPPERIKDTPICMNQYRSIFGTTRVPGSPADKIRSQFPAKARHIIVMARDQIYKIDVYRDDGSRLPLKEIERLLYEVTGNCQETKQEKPIGLLTAGHRDNWAAAYDKLCKLSPKNKENFETIQTSLFAICLDDHSNHHSLNASHLQFFHNNDARNRWFDKAISLIVSSSGQAGVNGEHSPVDAVVPGRVFDFVIEHEPAVDPSGAVADPPMPPVQKLAWDVDESIETHIKEASTTAKALIDETDSCLVQTDIYGSRFIKEVAKCPPDAYVQIALQLTYYRLHGVPTAVYESASTRAFKHGRMETGRIMSSESLSFIQSFDDDNVLYDEKRVRFAKAIAVQSGYMKDAAAGKGIDRHMLGLRCMIRSESEQKAASKFFGSPGVSQSVYFRLSTSNMSPGKNFYGGFGPVVSDGYGVNYAIDKDQLKFSISSKRNAKAVGDANVSCRAFEHTLKRTLQDMFILFPKRTEVWGYGWEKLHEQERKAERMLKNMKRLSDERRAGQEELAKRYAPKDGSKSE